MFPGNTFYQEWLADAEGGNSLPSLCSWLPMPIGGHELLGAGLITRRPEIANLGGHIVAALGAFAATQEQNCVVPAEAYRFVQRFMDCMRCSSSASAR